MKPSPKLVIWKNGRPVAHCAIPATPQVVPSGAILPAITPKDLRRLKWNEVVSRGDFVADEARGFESWEGPSGFRAGSFIKLIYRRIKGQPVAVKSRR